MNESIQYLSFVFTFIFIIMMSSSCIQVTTNCTISTLLVLLSIPLYLYLTTSESTHSTVFEELGYFHSMAIYTECGILNMSACIFLNSFLCEKFNVKMTILSRVLYRSSGVLIQILMTLFKILDQILLKYLWNHKIPQIAKEMLRGK